jgi:ABC-type branched-subunit amino acid transport system ATPase component
VSLLEATGLSVRYGGIRALDDVDLVADEGSIVGLVGANGAGKTTALECIAGFIRPDQGRVTFAGEDVTALPAEDRARRGMARSFQDARLFPGLSVYQALLLAQERELPTSLSATILGLPVIRRRERARRARADQLVDGFGLAPHVDKLVGELSPGLRRALDLACIVALRPRLLLLDEPSSGLAEAEAIALDGVLRRVRADTGATMVMVEHDLRLAFGLSDVVVVMETARVVASGPPATLRHHPAVRSAFLGG